MTLIVSLPFQYVKLPFTSFYNVKLLILQYFKKTMKLGDTAKKLKTQIWSSVVTVVLVEGHNLLAMDDNGFSDPYVKFRLGNEKYKSKVSTFKFVWNKGSNSLGHQKTVWGTFRSNLFHELPD